MPDNLDVIARQVRMLGTGATGVHRLSRAVTAKDGRVYRATCGRALRAATGAILTTSPVGCPRCRSAEEEEAAIDRLLDAILHDPEPVP